MPSAATRVFPPITWIDENSYTLPDGKVTTNPWKHPAWIVSTPRSGSTMLATRLNASVGFESDANCLAPFRFEEHFHPQAFRRYPHFDPYVTKLHVHWIEAAIVVTSLPPSSTKIIRLTREDHLSQAWSLITSSRTSIHNTDTTEEVTAYRKALGEVETTEAELQSHLTAIANWGRLGKCLFGQYQRLDITYEFLVARPQESMKLVMDFLEMPPDTWKYQDAQCLQLTPAAPIPMTADTEIEPPDLNEDTE